MTRSADDFASTIASIIRELSAGVTVGEGRPIAQGGTFRRESLGDAYRWLHGATLEPTRRPGTSRICPDCQGSGWARYVDHDGVTRARACECGSNYQADPTGAAVVNGDRMRAKAATASKLLEGALANVLGCIEAIQAGFNLIDGHAERTIDERGRWPQVADSGEIARAREAKARRDARTEGFGETHLPPPLPSRDRRSVVCRTGHVVEIAAGKDRPRLCPTCEREIHPGWLVEKQGAA